jgi:hypothetical protein
MRRINANRLVLCVAAIAVAAFVQVPAKAQEGLNAPVIVAVPDVFPTFPTPPNYFRPPRVVALIVREPEAGRVKEIIVLDATRAQPEVLQFALLALQQARREAPVLEHGHVIAVTGFAHTRKPNPRTIALLRAKLDRLREQPTVQVGNLGPGRYITLASPEVYR